MFSATATDTPVRNRARAVRRLGWAPVVTLALLAVLLLEGPQLARATGLAALLPSWPIESVAVTGELHQVSREELTGAISEVLDGDFFGLDVGAVRAVALEVPWVDEVSVRKVWPGKLHVQVRERHAAARWRDGGLLDTLGRPFEPGQGTGLAQLPMLAGPAGSERAVLDRYRTLALALAPMGRRVEWLELDRRSGWRVGLDGDLTLVFGHDMTDAALERLAAGLPAMLGERFGLAARIDLRYANGFAVRWRHGTAVGETTE